MAVPFDQDAKDKAHLPSVLGGENYNDKFSFVVRRKMIVTELTHVKNNLKVIFHIVSDYHIVSDFPCKGALRK